MNFLGHAAAARWTSDDPRFVLGAMLPDFAHMGGVRRIAPIDEVAIAGVAFHHRTDEAFHGAPSFVRLTHEGTDALQAAGVGRGPALALGHLAIELLLDAVLAEDDALVAAYQRALAVELELAEPEHHRIITGVRARLAEAGAPRWYAELDELAPRLERILARRPRLALAPSDRAPLRRWLDDAHAAVERSASALMAELDVRLATSAHR